MRLDVGCENELRGNINVDLSIPGIVHNKVFIMADGQHLPFIDNAFEETTCYHLIEHVENPHLLLGELLRVTKHKVEIKCPYRFSLISKSPQHKHYFNMSWFKQQLEKYNVIFKISLNLDSERHILKIPLQIIVKIWRKREPLRLKRQNKVLFIPEESAHASCPK